LFYSFLLLYCAQKLEDISINTLKKLLNLNKTKHLYKQIPLLKNNQMKILSYQKMNLQKLMEKKNQMMMKLLMMKMMNKKVMTMMMMKILKSLSTEMM